MSKRAADIVFLLDVTASMQPCINALQRNIADFIDFLSTEDGNNELPVKDWRGKVVGYRDVVHDGDDWYEDHPFVRDADTLKSQLHGLSARGGGDEPESLLDAIYRVGLTEEAPAGFQEEDPTRWRYRKEAARVVVIFTDASFHETMSLPEAKGGTVGDVSNLCVNNKLLLSIFAPEMGCYDELAAIRKAEYETISDADEDPREGLSNYTSDQANFTNVLQQLAASISKSAECEIL